MDSLFYHKNTIGNIDFIVNKEKENGRNYHEAIYNGIRGIISFESVGKEFKFYQLSEITKVSNNTSLEIKNENDFLPFYKSDFSILYFQEK